MACGAARLEPRVAFCGMVGDDAFGRFMRDELAGRGVDAVSLRVDPTSKTGVTVVLSRGQDRAILTYPGTIAAPEPSMVDAELPRDTRHVHVSSFFRDALMPGLPALFDVAREAGATTSVDPNWDPAERWDGGLFDVRARTDVFLPNAEEAMRIARVDDVAAAARRLAEATGTVVVKATGTVVVKAGNEGGLAVHADAEPVFVPARPIEVVDTTGAVDAQPTRDEAEAFLRQGVLA